MLNTLTIQNEGVDTVSLRSSTAYQSAKLFIGTDGISIEKALFIINLIT
jgi:hypothetical protein